jgi:hypothetical protein
MIDTSFGADPDTSPVTWASEPAPSNLPALPDPSFQVQQQQLPTAPTSTDQLAPALLPAQLVSEPSPSARRGAGMALVLAGLGVATGAVFGGAWGAGAGFILVGAARNGWRAKSLWPSTQPGDREEAAKSATMATIGAALGGYLAYRAVKSRKTIRGEE